MTDYSFFYEIFEEHLTEEVFDVMRDRILEGGFDIADRDNLSRAEKVVILLLVRRCNPDLYLSPGENAMLQGLDLFAPKSDE